MYPLTNSGKRKAGCVSIYTSPHPKISIHPIRSLIHTTTTTVLHLFGNVISHVEMKCGVGRSSQNCCSLLVKNKFPGKEKWVGRFWKAVPIVFPASTWRWHFILGPYLGLIVVRQSRLRGQGISRRLSPLRSTCGFTFSFSWPNFLGTCGFSFSFWCVDKTSPAPAVRMR